MIPAAATGFFTGFSLILAIGAQNAFVLRQGILQQHVFILCLICAVSDAFLIALGVGGFGYMVSLFPALPFVMSLAGAGFLLAYGAMRFRAALNGDALKAAREGTSSRTKVILAALAFTWLNPHVYLDTLGLVGAVSTRYPDAVEKLAFGIGAATASFSFFFGLGYGARLLAPVMQSRRAWQVMDTGIGVVMWGLAAGLLRSAFA